MDKNNWTKSKEGNKEKKVSIKAKLKAKLKAKVYLKIIFSSLNEVKYIKMSLEESKGFVDKIIVTECNVTHTGQPRELFFGKLLEDGHTFSEEEREKIVYIPGDLSKKARNAKNSSVDMHYNETLIRGFFVKEMKLRGWDIVLAVDADEVIYHRFWPEILKPFRWYNINPALFLELNTFFYKPSWLWEDCFFRAPTICRVWRYWLKYPANWRYDGKKLGYNVGGHFSWNLTIDEMISKLSSYAHSAEYGHLAQRDILKNAIMNKEYPFNKNVNFHIKELDIVKDKEYYPDEMKEYISYFTYLYDDMKKES